VGAIMYIIARARARTHAHTNAHTHAHRERERERKLLCGIMERGTKQNYWKYDRLASNNTLFN